MAIAALASGIITCQMMRHSDSPSIFAASMSERGTASKLALKTKMQTMVDIAAAPGRDRCRGARACRS